MAIPNAPKRRRPSPGRATLYLLALGTAVGLLLFSQHYLDTLATGDPADWLGALTKELTGAYAAMLLLPGIIWMARHFPLTGRGWPRHLLPHLVGALAFGAAHTSLMLAARAVLFPAFGLEPYDPGPLLARYLRAMPVHVIVYSLALAVTLVFDRYRVARDREIDAAELRSHLTEAQLLALQRQLQPQLLANTLNAVAGLVYARPKVAEEMIARVSALLRYAFRPQQEPETSLAAELRLLDLFLEIMRLRFAERLFVRVDVPKPLHGVRVPRLLLHPLVEDALERSADPDATLLNVQVSARQEGNRLMIRVSDQSSRKVAPGEPGETVGNLRERIARLYGDGYGIEIFAPETGGRDVEVTLPLRTESARTRDPRPAMRA
ncbi:MAG TPA: histidine kinase [Xanthomonadaceae bacterium]|nr:histidine kinase [Xanthomonadaceae bacterium]